MKKLVKLFLALLMAVSFTACAGKPATDESGIYTAGTYTGSAKGNNGDVTVEVVLSADRIESVTVTNHQETPGLSDGPIADIPEAIVNNQSLNIDAVSGATNTSNGILDAVNLRVDLCIFNSLWHILNTHNLLATLCTEVCDGSRAGV